MRHLLTPALLSLLFAACGLAEGDQDQDNKHIYIHFQDPHFEAYCLSQFDLNEDGHVSRYEAQRAVQMDCAGLKIASLSGIGEFINLRSLDCGNNLLEDLDVTRSRGLETLICTQNRLTVLRVESLRVLKVLQCGGNKLERLDLRGDVSLSLLLCDHNDLSVLDVSGCASNMDRLNAKENPRLSVVYKSKNQRIVQSELDAHTTLQDR
ncbi:MAG: leucine-rich repeat domain-containing protein [Alistipes sp.]